MMMTNHIDQIKEATIAGKMAQAIELTDLALKAGVSPGEVIQQGFIPAMEVVGDNFAAGKIYVPEMLLAARAMKAALDKVKPHLVGQEIKTLGKAVIGTVQGDMHDIGKNLVAMMLEGSGFEIIDLGVDVLPDEFIKAVKDHKPDLMALSALLTTTMNFMEMTIVKLAEAGLRDGVKILVGGAPVSQRFADEIGGDGYAANAGEAVKLAKKLLA
jgi:5-methyltetrahydrofolate--homocysteine methyltransferase